MNNLEAACIEAFATSPSNVAVLDTLEIVHPLVGTPIRIVKNRSDLSLTLETSSTVTFKGVAFTISLPKSDEGGVQALDLVIDDVGEELKAFINTVKSSLLPVEVKYRPYLSTVLSAPQNSTPLRLVLSGIRQANNQVTAKASFGDLVNKLHISELYTRLKYPSLAG